MTVDTGSWELAKKFMSDYKDEQLLKGSRIVNTKELAEAIQKAIEDWLCDNTIPF